ncbi:MAG: hypothetical protein E7G24_04370 [Clostridium celatum]|uniref:hypothetical protein n=1 Tax=Clostridium celatum TaxID=36834 RepID=UPI0028FE4050|nr:hypothetical protein [Clostridium celatum]MDU3722431.1 hypothetical protein [Clostridium celatum]
MQKDVDIIENYLNNRPRKCLGYKITLEAFNLAIRQIEIIDFIYVETVDNFV